MASFLHSLLFNAYVTLADTVFASVDINGLSLSFSKELPITLRMKEHLVIEVLADGEPGRIDVLHIVHLDTETPEGKMSLGSYVHRMTALFESCTKSRVAAIVDTLSINYDPSVTK
jgi:hypothetical protein